jgi:hypothetical protein
LILTFDAILTLNGKDSTRNVKTLTQPIEVEVGWPETGGEWFEFFKKWFENVSWLWATILVPVGIVLIALWRRWTGQKKELAQEDS